MSASTVSTKNVELIKNELEILIFLHDRTTLRVFLEGVQSGNTGSSCELIDVIIREQSLPEESKDIFSLWLISPLLELRLKSDHVPHDVAQQWEEICSQYTDSRPKDIARDEPLLYFQRNVFYSPLMESKVTNSNVLLYLYYEAKYNVLQGRYVVSLDDYHQLAGIQSLLRLQHYDPQTHIQPFYRSHLEQYYPDHLCRPAGYFAWKKSSCDVLAGKLEEYHRAISEHYAKTDIAAILPHLYRKYLKICWSYPFYGATFFTGLIDQPSQGHWFLRGKAQVEVYVAVNTDGLSIIDREKCEVLLSIPFTQLSWEISCNEDNSALYVFFKCESSADACNLITVYTKQVRLIDALITSCVNVKRCSADVTDAAGASSGECHVCDFGKIKPALDRLHLVPYSPDSKKTKE